MSRVKEFNKNEVLNKAIILFWNKGYHNTSAQDLVDNLGISRSSIYDTFGNKHTLFIKALKEYRRQAAGALIEMLNNSTDVEKTIVAIFNSLINVSVHCQKPRGCFLVNSAIELAPHDTEVAEIISQNMMDIEDAFYKIIKRGQDEGRFSKKHTARSLARSFYNVILGIRVAARSEVNKKVYDDIVKVSLASLY